jgi:hypothetical protein
MGEAEITIPSKNCIRSYWNKVMMQHQLDFELKRQYRMNSPHEWHVSTKAFTLSRSM